MSAWIVANIAPIMFAGLVVFLLLGFPVSFALAALGLSFGLLGIQFGLLNEALFQALPERIFGIMANDTLLADQLGRSVGDMYAGAIFPGMVLTALYALFVLGMTIFYPSFAPALPPEARPLRGWKLIARVVFVLIPPLALIFLVLGTIFIGVATPTEGGAMGATGALVLALINRRLTWSLLRQAMNSTAKLTTFVVFILVGSTVFSLTFRGVKIGRAHV